MCVCRGVCAGGNRENGKAERSEWSGKIGIAGKFQVHNQYAILLPIVSRFLISFAFVNFHGPPLAELLFSFLFLIFLLFFFIFSPCGPVSALLFLYSVDDFVCCRDFIARSRFVCSSSARFKSIPIPIPNAIAIAILLAKSHLTWHFNDVVRNGVPFVTCILC